MFPYWPNRVMSFMHVYLKKDKPTQLGKGEIWIKLSPARLQILWLALLSIIFFLPIILSSLICFLCGFWFFIYLPDKQEHLPW